MICVTLRNKNFDELAEILSGGKTDMAEICLDSCPLDDEQIEYIFGSFDIPLVASFRDELSGGVPGLYGSSPRTEEAEHCLSLAIEAGAAYVDIPVSASPQVGKRLCRLARQEGTVVIRSFEDNDKTPPADQLRGICEKCRRFGGEIIKLTIRTSEPGDWAAVKALYAQYNGLVACCLPAEIGTCQSASKAATASNATADPRIETLSLGAPFICAEPEEVEALKTAIYGSRKPYLRDGIRMPSSKSFAQRAILAAALAEGTSRLEGYTPCGDNEAALRVARELGATVVEERGSLTITGIGPLSGRLDIGNISAGESGLMARLLIPLLAAIGSGETTLTGERTLLNRPLKGAAGIMAPFGVILKPAPAAAVQPPEPPVKPSKELHIPLTVTGELIPGRADISGADGSQLISGLLMALPLTRKSSSIYVQDPKSIPYMFITLDVMRKFGVTVINEMEGDEEFVATGDWSLCTQIDFTVRAPQKYKAAQFTIEGDWSAAANYLVAGAIFGGVSIDGLAPDSLQADLSIVDILVEAGAVASQDEDGRINVRRAPLRAITVDLSNSPDLFPIVSVLACFCPGWSRLKGVGRLASKESDRAAAIRETLEKMGVEVGIDGDEMIINGLSLEQRLLTGTLLHGGEYSTYHDHRMLMALRVAQLGADTPITLDDETCVAKSYPGFAL